MSAVWYVSVCAAVLVVSCARTPGQPFCVLQAAEHTDTERLIIVITHVDFVRTAVALSRFCDYDCINKSAGWLGSRVVSVLDSGAAGPGFKSQS